MKNKIQRTLFPAFLGIACLLSPASAQHSKSLVNTSQSPYARLTGLGLGDVKWTQGFWAEESVQSKRWLGDGPYRVWQNRLQGVKFGIWENDYNDPIPGESFNYPEFKGYFSNWKWLTLRTTEGEFSLSSGDDPSFLGVYTPRDGRDALLYTLPESGIAVLKVIPAVRNKVNTTDLIGPSSQAKWLSGLQKGSVYLWF